MFLLLFPAGWHFPIASHLTGLFRTGSPHGFHSIEHADSHLFNWYLALNSLLRRIELQLQPQQSRPKHTQDLNQSHQSRSEDILFTPLGYSIRTSVDKRSTNHLRTGYRERMCIEPLALLMEMYMMFCFYCYLLPLTARGIPEYEEELDGVA